MEASKKLGFMRQNDSESDTIIGFQGINQKSLICKPDSLQGDLPGRIDQLPDYFRHMLGDMGYDVVMVQMRECSRNISELIHQWLDD